MDGGYGRESVCDQGCKEQGDVGDIPEDRHISESGIGGDSL